jgi:hypothetical protein
MEGVTQSVQRGNTTVNELIRALKDARDLVEALLKAAGEPPQWLVDEATQELVTLDELVARLEH